MRVIITGGTGLIGAALATDLIGDGHEVILLSRYPEQRTHNVPEGAQLLPWDARTTEGWEHWADGADAIVNLAGASIGGDAFLPARWTRRRKQLILESRLGSGQAVTQAVKAAAQKPDVVIQSSAVGYYGAQRDEALAEDAPPGSGFLAEVCQAWEKTTEGVERLGVRRAVIRTGIVLSLASGALPRLLLPFRLFAGGPFGKGEHFMPWIHIADEVRAIRYLIENNDASGHFNLSAPMPVTNRDFANTLGRVMKRPSFMPVPSLAMRLAFGEVSTVVLDGQRAVPTRLLQAGFAFKFKDLEPALRDILRQSRT